MSSVTRTIALRPFLCRDKKTGFGLDLHDVLEEVRDDATLCAAEALKHIAVENLEKLPEHDGVKPAVAGRRMGIKLPPGESDTGRSRFEAMVQEYAVTQLRSWRERRKTHTGKNG